MEDKIFYLKLDDLFYNLITSLKEAGINVDRLSYHDCEVYADIIQKHGSLQNYKIYALLNRDRTWRFYSDNYEYVEEVSWNNVKGIKLKKNLSTNELIEICRGYLPLQLLLLIIDFKVIKDTIDYYKEENNLTDDDIKNPLYKENKESVRERING